MKEDELNAYLESAELAVRNLAAEVLRLRQAIQKHRQKTGHEVCWLNDVELWQALGKNADYPHSTLPRQDEFLKQCSRFYESRLHGTPYAEPAVKQAIVSAASLQPPNEDDLGTSAP